MSSPRFGTLNPPGSQIITPDSVVADAADAIRAQVAADADRAASAAQLTHALADMRQAAPGDGVTLVSDDIGNPALHVADDGGVYGRFVLPPEDRETLSDARQTTTTVRDMVAQQQADTAARIPFPGEGQIFIEDADGQNVFGAAPDGTLYGKFSVPEHVIPLPDDPGEYVAPVFRDADGRMIFGIDTRDGSPWPGSSQGSSVDFVDPGGEGNAWMAIRQDGVTRYLSDQWGGRVWGFEQRDGKTIAQSHGLAVVSVAFGGGSLAVERPFPEPFPYHLLDETFSPMPSRQGASGIAAAFLAAEMARHRTLPTVIALTQPVGSTVEADAAPTSPHRVALLEKIKTARATANSWSKELFVDRIRLSLLEGAPQTDRTTADWHYAGVAQSMRDQLATAAGQVPLPIVVVMQSIGRRDNGVSEIALAEGTLDFAHWSLGIIVTGPLYPYPLLDGTPATLTPAAAVMADELCAIAVAEVQAGRQWFGPAIGTELSLSGSVLRVPFTAMTDLRLRDPLNHGFAVDGATITAAAVSGRDVLLTLDTVPAGDLVVRYAYGQTGDRGDGYAANRGSLTDDWSAPSSIDPSFTHYRHARSGVATLKRT